MKQELIRITVQTISTIKDLQKELKRGHYMALTKPKLRKSYAKEIFYMDEWLISETRCLKKLKEETVTE